MAKITRANLQALLEKLETAREHLRTAVSQIAAEAAGDAVARDLSTIEARLDDDLRMERLRQSVWRALVAYEKARVEFLNQPEVPIQ